METPGWRGYGSVLRDRAGGGWGGCEKWGMDVEDLGG